MEQFRAQLSEILDDEVQSISFFSEGQIGDIYKLTTSKDSYILKTSETSDRLEIEANMLKDDVMKNL